MGVYAERANLIESEVDVGWECLCVSDCFRISFPRIWIWICDDCINYHSIDLELSLGKVSLSEIMISATIGNYVFSKYLCETKGRQIRNTKFSKVLKVPPHLVKSKPHLKQLRELQNNYKLPKMLNPNTHKLISMQKPQKKLFPLDPRKGMPAGKVQSSELSFSFKILFVSSHSPLCHGSSR